jgi:large subunit ribosomal protein L15
MALSLQTIKYGEGSKKAKKRVGRGNSSGHGTYATRGLKGQKSRSGVSGLKRLGMKTMLRAIPKSRGFKSDKPKNQPVNIAELNKSFKDGDTVNPRSLAKAGLVDTMSLPVKILGNGDLNLKDLSFADVKISATAKEKIEKAGGRIKEQVSVAK